MKKRYKRIDLMQDFRDIASLVGENTYLLTGEDCFALGYLAGKYNVDRFINNQASVIRACKEYDETDDLGLDDTIGEILFDLEIIKDMSLL